MKKLIESNCWALVIKKEQKIPLKQQKIPLLLRLIIDCVTMIKIS